MSDSTVPPPPGEPPPPPPPPGGPPPGGPPPGTPPPSGAPGAGATSNRAVVALVLGVLSLICCYPLGPVAWYVGNQELKAIQAGTVPDSNRVIALIGVILGIIGTVFLALFVLWIMFMGGVATLRGLSHGW